MWDWLKTQPDSEAIKDIKQDVLSSAGYQDPALAMRFVTDLPRTPDGVSQIKKLADSLFNGGSMLDRFDKLVERAPERLRGPLVDAAFKYLRGDSLDDPQLWIGRLSLLPDSARAQGIESIARAWAERTPEQVISWAAAFAPGDGRNAALAGITSGWAKKDTFGAAEWVASMPPGPERDRSAGSLVLAIAERFPREAWDWALSINDYNERSRAAAHATKMMASRDAATARQWIESGPFTPENRAELRAALEHMKKF